MRYTNFVLFCYGNNIRPKKFNYVFLNCLQPQHQKCYCIPRIHIEKLLRYIENCQFKFPVISCLVTVVHILNDRSFQKITWIHHFYRILIKKIKSHPSTSFLKKVTEKHNINFLDLISCFSLNYMKPN